MLEVLSRSGSSQAFFEDDVTDEMQAVAVPALVDGVAEQWVNPYYFSHRPWHEIAVEDLDLVLVAEALTSRPGPYDSATIEVPSFLRRTPSSTIDQSPVQLTKPVVSQPVEAVQIIIEGQLCLETPQAAEFAREFTRVELIVALAEKYYDSEGTLPSQWALKKVINQASSWHSLLKDELFADRLRDYQAGREKFISHVKQQMLNPRYISEVLASPARAEYLDTHRASGLLTTNQNEGADYGEQGKVW